MAINSMFTMLGATNHTEQERAENDFYATDPIAIDALLQKTELSQNVWECACGKGDLSKRLTERGYNVKSTDIIDRGYGEGGVDFLKCTEPFNGDIITNPPFKYAQEFIEHALDLIPEGNRVFMLLRLQFLEGKRRMQLYNTAQFKTLYVSTSRILCAKNGEFEQMRAAGGSAMALGWFVFEKGYSGKPTIEWIN